MSTLAPDQLLPAVADLPLLPASKPGCQSGHGCCGRCTARHQAESADHHAPVAGAVSVEKAPPPSPPQV